MAILYVLGGVGIFFVGSFCVMTHKEFKQETSDRYQLKKKQ